MACMPARCPRHFDEVDRGSFRRWGIELAVGCALLLRERGRPARWSEVPYPPRYNTNLTPGRPFGGLSQLVDL